MYETKYVNVKVERGSYAYEVHLSAHIASI